MAAVAGATTGASAIIENGVVVNQTTPQQKAEKEKTAESQTSASAQKDQFLQLLVAQMKYQDPLEPTSNTEYISQYATFSSLEQMQNMSATLTMSRANEMAGKSVVIHHQETGGGTQEIEGIVDYVTFENNKAKVYVNGSAYDVDEVYAVMDDSYTKKAELAESFEKALDSLPKLYMLTEDDAQKVENLANSYDAFDKTTQSLVGSNYVTTLLQYVNHCVEKGWISARSEEGASVNGTDGTNPVAPADETKASDTQEENEGNVTEASKAVTPETEEEKETDGEAEDELIQGADEPMET